jgi:predicted phosphodiesterase
MGASTRLSRVFDRARQDEITFTDQDKFIIFSDQHRGKNDWGDDFAHNQFLFFHALNTYYQDGWTYIENGDGDELAENWNFRPIYNAHSNIFWAMKRFHDAGRLIMIYGNHDILRRYPGVVRRSLYETYDHRRGEEVSLFRGIQLHDAIVLKHQETGKRLFITHGHQADFSNYWFSWLGVLLLPIWKGVFQKMLGWRDPTSPAQNNWKKTRVEDNMLRWAKEHAQVLIAGHTHRPWHPNPGQPPYFNAGSCVHPRAITGIEIQNGTIALVKWWLNTKPKESSGGYEYSRLDRDVYLDRQLIMTDRDGNPTQPIKLVDLVFPLPGGD